MALAQDPLPTSRASNMALISRSPAAPLLLLLAIALSLRRANGCAFDSAALGGCVLSYSLANDTSCEANWATVNSGLNPPTCLVFKFLSTTEGWQGDGCAALARGVTCQDMGVNSWPPCSVANKQSTETEQFPPC